jgi:hypothetical protein
MGPSTWVFVACLVGEQTDAGGVWWRGCEARRTGRPPDQRIVRPLRNAIVSKRYDRIMNVFQSGLKIPSS